MLEVLVINTLIQYVKLTFIILIYAMWLIMCLPSNPPFFVLRLIGTFRMVLQQLVEMGQVKIADYLLDDNNVVMRVSRLLLTHLFTVFILVSLKVLNMLVLSESCHCVTISQSFYCPLKAVFSRKRWKY